MYIYAHIWREREGERENEKERETEYTPFDALLPTGAGDDGSLYGSLYFSLALPLSLSFTHKYTHTHTHKHTHTHAHTRGLPLSKSEAPLSSIPECLAVAFQERAGSTCIRVYGLELELRV